MTNFEELITFNEERERFREFAILNNMHHDIVIDKSDYASISCIDGLFYKDGIITVYSTDERCEIYYEKIYTDPKKAFGELARRSGFEYDIKTIKHKIR